MLFRGQNANRTFSLVKVIYTNHFRWSKGAGFQTTHNRQGREESS